MTVGPTPVHRAHDLVKYRLENKIRTMT